MYQSAKVFVVSDLDIVVGIGSCYCGLLVFQFLWKRVLWDWRSCLTLAVILASHKVLQFWSLPLIATVSLIVSLLYHWNSLKQPQLPVAEKFVLITGCDRGIGFELACQLDSLGYRVIASCLSAGGPGAIKLRETTSSKLTIIQLDVQDPTEVKKAAQSVKTLLGQERLWAIINNAGICFIGNVEIMPLTDIYRIMAINFLGPLNMCKTFLPFLRRSKGRVINVASNAGLAPVPHMGVYCASKAALAMFTESLRFEQKVWGVAVSTVVPSGYRTGIMAYDKETTAKRWWKEASPTVKHDLGQDCFKPEFKYKNHESHTTPDLSSIVDTISYALSVKYPKPFYYSGFLARTLPYVYHYLPPALSDIAVEVLGSWFEFKPQALQPHHQLNGMVH